MNISDNHRPWGFYENLTDTDTHKVKRITVYPGKRLSLQSHKKRSEHWFIIDGSAVVSLNGEGIELHPGEHVNIGIGDKHRIENSGDKDLIFIEIQTGTYFGEDDIERFEDDYGRVEKNCNNN